MNANDLSILSVPETEDISWSNQDLPGAHVVFIDENGTRVEKLICFYESFSAALDLTMPDDIIEIK